VGTFLGNSRQTTQSPQNTRTNYSRGSRGSKPEGFYHPLEDCPVCKGAGFVHPLDANGKPIWDKIVSCTYKGCLEDSARAYHRGEPVAAGHGVTAVEQIFDTFVLEVGAKQAYKYAKEFANGTAKFVWLLIYGGYGCGKSHLCNAITRMLLSRGQEVQLVTAAEMFSRVKEAGGIPESEAMLRKYTSMFILLIDDLNVHKMTKWEGDRLEDLLVSRFATARPTVITTNNDFAELPGTIRSRFSDKTMARMVHNSALDYRGKKV